MEKIDLILMCLTNYPKEKSDVAIFAYSDGAGLDV